MLRVSLPVEMQLMHAPSLAAVSPRGLPPAWWHTRFLQLLSSQPNRAATDLPKPWLSPRSSAPAGQRRLQLWWHATSCTYSQGISEEIKLQLPKCSPSLPGPTPRASPLSFLWVSLSPITALQQPLPDHSATVPGAMALNYTTV